MNDTEEGIGECLTCETLCIVHSVAGTHVTVVRSDKVLLDHLDCMDCKRIGEFTVCSGNICLNGVCHCIHTCVGNELLGHCLSEIGIDDCHIRCDLEVSDRILDTLLVVGDD